MLNNVALVSDVPVVTPWTAGAAGRMNQTGFPGEAPEPLHTRGNMRSELVYSAGIRIPNRFLLTTLTIKAVQSLHISSTRTEDTANRVFAEVASGHFTDVRLPSVMPQPALEPLLIVPAA